MSEAKRGSERTRRALGWVARVGLSALLLWWLFREPQTWQAVTSLDGRAIETLGLAVGLYAGCQLLNAYKWWLLLRGTGQALSYGAAVRITFIGMFSNFFLPTSIGGDLIRVGLAAREGVPLTTGTLTVFLQRFTGLLAMLVIGLGGVIAGAAGDEQAPSRVLLVAAVFSLIGLALMAFGALAEQRWQLGDRLPPVLGRPVRKLGAGLRQLAGAPRLLSAVLGVSVIYQLLMVSLQAMLGSAAGVNPALSHWFWIVPMMTLGEMVPLGLAGIGPREATADYLFTQLGYPHEGVLASLLWQAMKVLTSLPGGLFLLFGPRVPEPPE